MLIWNQFLGSSFSVFDRKTPRPMRLIPPPAAVCYLKMRSCLWCWSLISCECKSLPQSIMWKRGAIQGADLGSALKPLSASEEFSVVLIWDPLWPDSLLQTSMWRRGSVHGADWSIRPYTAAHNTFNPVRLLLHNLTAPVLQVATLCCTCNYAKLIYVVGLYEQEVF